MSSYLRRIPSTLLPPPPLCAYLAAAADDALFGHPSITVVVLSVKDDLVAAKYGPRGYRYSLIEAGHVAQQVQDFCAAERLAVLEYGGFLDLRLSEVLGIEGIAPLLMFAVGQIGDDISSDSQARALPVEHESAILDVLTTPASYAPSERFPLTSCIAALTLNAQMAYGRGFGVSTVQARTAAVAEAYERIASGILRIDAVAPAVNLTIPWVDPDKAFPLSVKQRDALGLGVFRKKKVLEWVTGTRLITREETLVPIDFVFYPLHLKHRQPIYRATSSGVAAHTDKDTAVQLGSLELVERDAVMKTWLAKCSPARIPPSWLDSYTRDRVRYWSGKGEGLFLLYLPSEYSHCVLAAIFLDRWPYFACGAAAGVALPNVAYRATLEAEALVADWDIAPEARRVAARDVHDPYDHSRFSARRGSARALNWLKEGQMLESVRTFDIGDLRGIDPIIVELGDPNGSLHVIRVIAECLVPINFGWDFIHRRHPGVRGHVRNRAHVHFFG